MPVIVPAVVPPRQVDCITVEGKKYCEKEELTHKELGCGILVTVILVVYIGTLMYLGQEHDNQSIPILGILIPLILLGVGLLLV
jgi:hypothetical protein